VTSAGFTENFEAVAYPIDRMRKLWGVNVDGTYLFATGVARHLVRFFVPWISSGRSLVWACFSVQQSPREEILRMFGMRFANLLKTTRWRATPRAAWSLSAA
jgi:hypothetical protein